MSTYSTNEFRSGLKLLIDGVPYNVLENEFVKPGKGQAFNRVKLRNLKTGSVKEHSFGSSDKVAEAELESRPVKYLYFNKGEYWFCEVNDPSKRFQLDSEMLGDKMKFIKPNSTIDTISFPAQSGSASGGNDEIIGVKVPIKVELKVTEAPPDMRGNTAQGGSKQVTLESGAVINVPMFVKEGDVIRINTETGDYVERA